MSANPGQSQSQANDGPTADFTRPDTPTPPEVKAEAPPVAAPQVHNPTEDASAPQVTPGGQLGAGEQGGGSELGVGDRVAPGTDGTPRMPMPVEGGGNRVWWPDQLNLKMLDHDPREANPQDPDFDYAKAFATIDLDQLEKDVEQAMFDSKEWWPADFGNYGPLFVRMAWHSAGTYRVQDGRGGSGHGQQRFAPLNSWPDNVSLDKARRLLWPIKKKYGRSLSWADLMIFTGTVAMKKMGLPIFGFGGGRVDEWEPDDDVYWGPETSWLGDKRYTGNRDLERPLAAVQMGLIYVNPEGPDGVPDPAKSAHDVRETFTRMGMNDEETVALIGGGHTFGKTHGAAPDSHLGAEPEAAPMEQMDLGWKNNFGSGAGNDAITSGLEVTWTYHPTEWDNEFFEILYRYEWELMESPAGAHQWRPTDNGGEGTVPMAQGNGRREPRMLTSDLALRADPEYDKIARRFKDDHAAFTDAFARAWYKLTHRDMGPKVRLVGKWVPEETLLWQDPLPKRTLPPLTDGQIADLKAAIRASGLSIPELVKTAWASASTFRSSDYRGGANGARIRLEPQRHWKVNDPAMLDKVLPVLEKIAAEHGASVADTIVLAGGVAIEDAAKAAGVDITVPFLQGRVDATQEQTDQWGQQWLEPLSDGFRNYQGGSKLPAEYALVDKASTLGLRMPEMTVLLAGLRTLGANWDNSDLGQFENAQGVLDNSWFVNLLDYDTKWQVAPGHAEKSDQFTGTHPGSGKELHGTRADLVFGSNSVLRAQSEFYGADDAKEKFVKDFVAAWVKVMNADRFDVDGAGIELKN